MINVQIGAGKNKWFNGDSENPQAFYRLWPFAKLTGVQVHEEPTVGLGTLHKMDWVVFHQPMDPTILNYIAMCKQTGVKVWIDMDDLVIENSVPPANPAAQYFRPSQVQKTLRLSLEAADVVSVTTKTLKDALIQWWKVPAKKIHVIPNAIPDELWALRREGGYNKPRRIIWRGSITHMGDLLLLKDAFKDYENIDFVFFGHEPWMLYQRYGGKLSKVMLKDWSPGFLNFLDNLASEQPDYGVICLENVPFNYAKSNIAWLEYTWAGIATIAPRYMPEFDQGEDCIISYGKPGAEVGKHYAHELAQVFKQIDEGRLDKSKFLEASRARIEAKYLLSKVNATRLILLQGGREAMEAGEGGM
jgi:hypothetical protein